MIWLPLSDDAAKQFDTAAATTWFQAHEGLPYGYHNIIFGWIDTAADNLPQLLPFDFVPILFSMLSHIIGPQIDIMFTQAINKRLNVEGKSIPELAAIAAKQ